MRAGNITIVELRINHGLTDSRLFYALLGCRRRGHPGAGARRWMPPTCSRHNPDATA